MVVTSIMVSVSYGVHARVEACTQRQSSFLWVSWFLFRTAYMRVWRRVHSGSLNFYGVRCAW